MKRGLKILILVGLSGCLFYPAAKALVSEVPGNPYEGISTRNVFALKPPLALTAPPDNTVPPSNITLSGITDILGRKQALLKVQVPPRPPAQPAKEESYILTEGQSEGGIEVLAIDQKAGTVKVNNHGTIQTLDFANNGTKLPAASSLPFAASSMPPMNITPPGLVPIPPAPNPANTLNRDQQAALIELERVRLQASGDPTAKFLPPTHLSSLEGESVLPQ